MRLLAAFALLFALTQASLARADSSLVFRWAAGPPPRVEANGQVVIRLRGGSPLQAREIARRLNLAANQGARAGWLTASGSRRAAQMRVAGRPLVTINRRLARLNRLTPLALAQSWQKSLAQVFSRPYLAVATGNGVVPVGEQRTLPLRGNLPPALRAISSQPQWIAAAVGSSGLTLAGLTPGRSEIRLVGPGIDFAFPFRSMRYACQVVGSPAARVTGSRVPAGVVAEAARQALYQAVSAEPGVSFHLEGRAGQGLGPDLSQIAVPVLLVASGPELLPVRKLVPVAVTRSYIPPRPAALLMVSNYPERLPARGIWFDGHIESGNTVRLLYHHVNGGDSAMLAVEVANPGPAPAVVQVVGAGVGPSRDEIYVGHMAASLFLERQAGDAGYLVTVPPGTRFRPFQHFLPRACIASGVAELRVISGQTVGLQVRLNHPDDRATFLPADSRQAAPVLSRWKFPDPVRTIEASYTVGGQWAFISVGRHPIRGINQSDSLDGNYGVIYRISLALENPKDRLAQVDLLLSAPSGPARGVALIEGRKVETGLVPSEQEFKMASFRLAPGQRRVISIQTMPQSGSFYPVYIVARGG